MTCACAQLSWDKLSNNKYTCSVFVTHTKSLFIDPDETIEKSPGNLTYITYN